LEEGFMAYQRSIMTTIEDLLERIENIPKIESDSIVKLTPRELGILATSLKDLLKQKRKYILRDYRQKSIDL
jgi:hypothetical protein